MVGLCRLSFGIGKGASKTRSGLITFITVSSSTIAVSRGFPEEVATALLFEELDGASVVHSDNVTAAGSTHRLRNDRKNRQAS